MSELPKAKAIRIWSFEGRSSRTEYFVVLLLTVPVGAIVGLMMGKGGALGFFGVLFFVVLLWVSMSASARRMHDIGLSGWWTLIALVPGANILFGLYALFAPGQDHDNDYGPSLSSLPADAGSTLLPLDSRVQVQQPVLTQGIVNLDAITQAPVGHEPIRVEPLEEFWAQALHECESAAMKAGLWARAFADAAGDERIAKATYIRLRAAQLQEKYAQQQQDLHLARDQALQAEEDRKKVQEAEIAEVLAKMSEAKRVEALIPKGMCPACSEVIPLDSDQCPKCTALFTEDSNWKIKPLSKYEAIAQKAVDDAVLYEIQTKEEKESNNTLQLTILAVVFIVCVMAIAYS